MHGLGQDFFAGSGSPRSVLWRQLVRRADLIQNRQQRRGLTDDVFEANLSGDASHTMRSSSMKRTWL